MASLSGIEHLDLVQAVLGAMGADNSSEDDGGEQEL